MKHFQQGVLWDMDGVLVNTREFHYQAWSRTLADYDVSFDYTFFRETFGMNNYSLLSRLFGPTLPLDQIKAIGDHKEALFRDLIRGQAQPLPGVVDWLKRLQASGARQAIASSAPWANINAHIDELALRPYFDAIVSAAEMPSKPDPTVFLEAACRVDVPPTRCTVIEDSVAGVEAAKRAGMRCIAVTTSNPADALWQADIVVTDLTQLPEDTFEQ
ncbi:MAG: HAD family phosphatase [Anaerolineae bacterium]|nr:HAD family phosphatase [Anaerolineae bacterium]